MNMVKHLTAKSQIFFSEVGGDQKQSQKKSEYCPQLQMNATVTPCLLNVLIGMRLWGCNMSACYGVLPQVAKK